MVFLTLKIDKYTTFLNHIGSKKQVVKSFIQMKVLETILKKAVMGRRGEATTIVDNQHIGKEAPRASY